MVRGLRCMVAMVILGALSPWVGVRIGVWGQILQCVGTDGCRCSLNDGSVIDVSSLGNNDGTPRFDKQQGQDLFLYSFNPCHPFTESTCTDSAVCQISGDQTAYYPAGDANTAVWSYDGINALVYYESASPDVLRQSYVTYVCDPTADPPVLEAQGELGVATYYLQVTSKCACPDGCSAGSAGSSGDDEGGLSVGSILLIGLFAALTVYLIAGIVFNKTQRQAVGLEVVPNASFWRAFPGLVKDGVLFLVGKVRGGKSGYSEV